MKNSERINKCSENLKPIKITILSNIVLEPHLKGLLGKAFDIHNLSIEVYSADYEELLRHANISGITDSQLVAVIPNFDYSWRNFIVDAHSDEIIWRELENAGRICSIIHENTSAIVVWFGYEDYCYELHRVLGNVPVEKMFIDKLNQQIYEFLRDDVIFIDMKKLVSEVGIPNAYDTRGRYRWNSPYSRSMVEVICNEICKQYLVSHMCTKKCLVLDCDNVLWGGILSEDGMDRVLLGSSGVGRRYQDFQRYLLFLYQHVNGTVPFGFRLVNKTMIPYEPEAEIIRTLFEMYLAGYSTPELVRHLEAEKIIGKSGKSNWNIRTVSHILANEKYVGDTLYRKTYRETTVPFVQHINYGQEDQYYATDTHQGIVTRETFDAVQSLLGKRQAVHGKAHENCIYPFTSRIRCTECGSFYRRRVLNGGIKWGCHKHIECSASCHSFYYSEERIEDGFVAMVNKLRFGEENVLGRVIEKLEYATLQYKRNNANAYEISQQMAELNAKLVMLEQLRAKGYLAPEIYQAQYRDINNQLTELKNSRQEALDNRLLDMLSEVKKLKALIDEIDEPLERFDPKLFASIVLTMALNNKDELTFTVLGGLKFTELI